MQEPMIMKVPDRGEKQFQMSSIHKKKEMSGPLAAKQLLSLWIFNIRIEKKKQQIDFQLFENT